MEPTSFAAGDAVTWSADLPDYLPGDGWALTYNLRGPASINLTATADGSAHMVTITAAASANYAAGRYWWSAYVTKGSERHSVGSGEMDITVNMAAVTGVYDGRSQVKRTLDAVNAVLEGRASKDDMSYSIAGRTLSRIPTADLLALRDKYAALYQQEAMADRAAKGLATGRRVLVRF